MTVTDTDTDTDAVVGIARNVDAATTDRLSCPVVLPGFTRRVGGGAAQRWSVSGEALWAAETEDALLAAIVGWRRRGVRRWGGCAVVHRDQRPVCLHA